MTKKLLNVFVMVLLSTLMIGCSKDKNDDEPDLKDPGQELVGRWTEIVDDSDEPPFILVFNSNNTGTVSFTFSTDTRASLTYSQKFNWTVGTTANGTNYCNILTISGDEIIEDGRYEYILIGNNMNFGSLRFKRN